MKRLTRTLSSKFEKDTSSSRSSSASNIVRLRGLTQPPAPSSDPSEGGASTHDTDIARVLQSQRESGRTPRDHHHHPSSLVEAPSLRSGVSKSSSAIPRGFFRGLKEKERDTIAPSLSSPPCPSASQHSQSLSSMSTLEFLNAAPLSVPLSPSSPAALPSPSEEKPKRAKLTRSKSQKSVPRVVSGKKSSGFTLGRKTKAPQETAEKSGDSPGSLPSGPVSLTQLTTFFLEQIEAQEVPSVKFEADSELACVPFFFMLPLFGSPSELLGILDDKLRLSSFLDSSSHHRTKSIASVVRLLTVWLSNHALRDFPADSPDRDRLSRFLHSLTSAYPGFDPATLLRFFAAPSSSPALSRSPSQLSPPRGTDSTSTLPSSSPSQQQQQQPPPDPSAQMLPSGLLTLFIPSSQLHQEPLDPLDPDEQSLSPRFRYPSALPPRPPSKSPEDTSLFPHLPTAPLVSPVPTSPRLVVTALPPPPPPLPPLPSAPLSAPSPSSPSSSPRDTKESISSPELDCSSHSSAPNPTISSNSSHLSTDSPHSASPNNASPNIPPVIPFDLSLTRTRRDSSPASKQDRGVLARGSNSPQPSRRQRGGSTSGSSPGETLSAAPRSPAAARRDRPRCESIPGPEPSLATIPSSLSAGCIADADKIGRFRTPPPEHSHQQVHPRSGAGSVSLSRTTGASSLNLIPKSRSSIPSAEAFGVELSPIQVAHGLSVHALAMFLAVDTREFLDYGFGSKQFGSETISRSVSYFNLVSNWVSTKILASPVVETRVATIRGFISVAHQLFKLNNFHLLTAVYAGLESSPIVRLKQTWAGISEKNRSRLKAIGEVLSALKNYSKYREVVSKLRANRQSCLPYLGIYLRDLTFIHEGNATMVNDLINYPKVQFVAALLSEFEYFRKRPIRVAKEATHHSHHSFLLDLPDTCSDPEVLYQKSLLAEPRDSVVPILDLNPSTLDPLPTNDVGMPSSSSLTSSSSFSSFSSSSAQSEEPSTSAEPPFDLASLPTLDPALLTRYHLEQAFFSLQKQNTELRLRIRQLESPN